VLEENVRQPDRAILRDEVAGPVDLAQHAVVRRSDEPPLRPDRAVV
jgi:hypothetical protein